jgi:hypothetical protein
MIQLMYSHPTFIFDNYTSHLLFSASIPSQRFHAIRSIRITKTHQTYYNRSKPSWTASYSLLCRKGVFVRNSDLPSLRQPDWPKWWDLEAKEEERTPALNEWQHIRKIMCAMQDLRNFRLDVDDTAYLTQQQLTGCDSTTVFWDEITKFFESRVFGGGFEVVLDWLPAWSDHAFVDVDFVDLADLGFVRGRGEKRTTE